MSQLEWEGIEDTQEDADEQRVLFAALDSFYQYAKTAHFNTTHLRRQNFYALPRAHVELLAAPPFSYLDTLNAVDDAIDKNAELALAILEAGLKSFGISTQSPITYEGKDAPEWRGKATSNDLEKARSTLRQFYRDWSEEGLAEREACYGPILAAVEAEQLLRSGEAEKLLRSGEAAKLLRSGEAAKLLRSREALRILVPGAGLGRLVFDLCCAGFQTEGNEISYHQLLASSYILNSCPTARAHTLYPWAHSFSNHKSRANHLKSVQIPDVQPGDKLSNIMNAGDMSMSASDFLLLYGDPSHKDTFDAVVTLFFLDTAPNVIRYIEAIKNCLRPGGILVNMGPLLWHFENNAPGTHGRGEDTPDSEGQGIADPGTFELTDDEVVDLVEGLGFDIEKKESNIAAPYIQDPESMLQHTYLASHWVARKR